MHNNGKQSSFTFGLNPHLAAGLGELHSIAKQVV
jgi:hypothetical protein